MSVRFELKDDLIRNVVALYDGGQAWLAGIDGLVNQCEQRWSVQCHGVLESTMSFVIYADRDDQPYAVLKLMPPSSEYFHRECAALETFDGSVARLLALDLESGAMLIERMLPGERLVAIANDDDVRANAIVASILAQLWQSPPSAFTFPTVASLEDGFDALETSEVDPRLIELGLFADGKRLFSELVATQSEQVLLHGDLHHANVLSQGKEWRAIDPQGIVGEREYDTAAAMRNPFELLESEVDLVALARRRARQYATALRLDEDRIVAWSFAQTVLSLCWLSSDGRAPIPAWLRYVTALAKLY